MLLSLLFVLGLCLMPADSTATGERRHTRNINLCSFSLTVLNIFIIIILFAEEFLGSPFLQGCFEEAKKIVDDAYTYSREE